jgi:hypothetical protein
MSYESENIIDQKTRLQDVEDFVKLLGFKYQGIWNGEELGKIRSYHWFEKNDYKSTNGVELSIYYFENSLRVTTRTNISRSYYDLEHQNKTIRFLRKHFGGTFTTDEGKGRYLQLHGRPPEPAASGCHLAFSNFGSNLIRARQYYDNRKFGDNEQQSLGLYWMDRYNPRLLSNNFILTFLVSISEDYWKSTYIALLKYSDHKESILKGGKIFPEKLVQISNGQLTVEEGFAESISFARISNVCNHFKSINKKLDFATVLKKPYRRRKKNMFDALEEMTELRNTIIHDASSPVLLEEEYIKDSINILHDSIERCYKELTNISKWQFDKTWGVGRLK